METTGLASELVLCGAGRGVLQHSEEYAVGSDPDSVLEGIYEEPMNDADGGWLWRYRAVTEIDGDGRRLFRFHRRFSQQSFGHLDVLLAVSMAVAIVSVSDALTLKVDHVELYLRPHDAFRLGPELIVDTDWPKWSSAAEVVDGVPEADADLTVVLVGR